MKTEKPTTIKDKPVKGAFYHKPTHIFEVWLWGQLVYRRESFKEITEKDTQLKFFEEE